MLCQFTVRNYKSIRDEMTFDMQATAISEHEDQILVTQDGEMYLPVAAIYGPNGGGKSNVLESLQMLVGKVLRPLFAIGDADKVHTKTKSVIEPFAFSRDTVEQPTEYELYFRTAMAEYRYILSIKKEIIEYERLDRIKLETGRRSGLFERDGKEIILKGAISRLKISDGVSDALPLLSYLGITYGKNEIIQDVLQWFQSGIQFINYGHSSQRVAKVVYEKGNVKELVLKMIREMDLNIVDFRIEEREMNRYEIFTTHSVNGYEVELNLTEESSGTRKLFGLLPFLVESLLYGTVLVVDELDAKIHPSLLKYIITIYSDMQINRNQAQLIFTSHDLSTMTSETFRRDEIWFVAKGNDENSKLYSLVEFKNDKGESVRKDAKYDKQYLEGRYGADPYLQRIIDWENIHAEKSGNGNLEKETSSGVS